MLRVQLAGDEARAWTEARGKSAYAMNLQVRVVCERCNNGWMSALETRVKPILSSLMAGTESRLSEDDLGVLAAWAFKTAGMYQQNDPGSRGISADALRKARAAEHPPEAARVYLFWMATRANSMRLETSGGTGMNARTGETGGVSSTVLCVDRVGILVTFSEMDQIDLTPQSEALHQIWPFVAPLDWPTAPVGDSIVDELTGHFYAVVSRAQRGGA